MRVMYSFAVLLSAVILAGLLPGAARAQNIPQEVRKQLAENLHGSVLVFREKVQERLAAVLKETLKEDQHNRLRQLELQQEGAFALLHGEAEIGNDLKITDEQRKQFMAVVRDMQKKKWKEMLGKPMDLNE